MVLEPEAEPVFHPDSYGYRPGRSALQAVAAARQRCWENDWAIDMDIRAFFDTVPWDLVLRAVRHHTRKPWVLLYVKRWLEAPLQQPDGTVTARTMGTPQGGAVAFAGESFHALCVRCVDGPGLPGAYPAVTFERYCDDVVVHCRSKAQAEFIRDKIAARLAECGLELHPVKTRLVYCKDSSRSGSFEHEQFTFLGYTFRPRLAKSRAGHFFVSFSPAVSREALTRIRHAIRGWRIHRRSDMTFAEIVAHINTYVAHQARRAGLAPRDRAGDQGGGDRPGGGHPAGLPSGRGGA